MNRPDTTLVIKYITSFILYFIELERFWSADKKIKDKIRRYDYFLKNKEFAFFTNRTVHRTRIIFIFGTRLNLNPPLSKISDAKLTIDVLAGRFDDVCLDPLGKVFYAGDSNYRYSIIGKLR